MNPWTSPRIARPVVAVLAGALLAALGVRSMPASAQQPVPDREALRKQLIDATAGRARLAEDPRRRVLEFFGTDVDRPVRRPSNLSASAAPEVAARRFLRTYGPLFGVDDEARQLRLRRATTADRGRSSVRFQQVHAGVPVVGGELVVTLDRSRNVLSTNGEVTPGLNVGVVPGIEAGEAARHAVTAIAKLRGLDPAALSASDPALSIYDPELLGGPTLRSGTQPASGPRTLVWRTEVTSSADVPVREFVAVDAQSGAIALHFDQIHYAKDRRICDRDNKVKADETCVAPYTRAEGGPPTGIADVDNAYTFSGQVYDYLLANFGRDSVNGAGLPLVSTVRYCETASACPVRNAFWNGTQATFGEGYVVDDIVAHEFYHAVTEFESNLFYYYQSGAINESLSDVFGELVDHGNGVGDDTASARGLNGEDRAGGATRDMCNPPAFSDPDAMDSPFYVTSFDDSGGVHTNSGVNNKAACLLLYGGTFNGITVTGIGPAKVAQIYHEANANLLTSGADYQDLYQVLRQACRNKMETLGITSADCAQVQNAVNAVKMNLTAPAIVPEAPVCAVGEAPTYLFFDNMENASSGNWTFGGTGGGGWHSDRVYATSGVRHLYGPDPATVSDRFAARSGDVVPPSGKTTYLHFRHSHDLETDYDGGIVEYSTNGGGSWTDAGPLFVNNGYNHTNANGPLAGRQVFADESNGYISSRLNLSTLAGQNVRYRFRILTDDSVSWVGWYVDDVRVYTCGPAPVISGSTWFAGGQATISGPSGTSVSAFATGASAGATYQLVTATEGCAVNPVAANPLNRVSNGRGFIATTNGVVNRSPGVYEVCFRSTDGTKATAPVLISLL